MQLSVIVPVYNEAEHLWDMAIALGAHLDRIVGAGQWQYVLIENGSTDHTQHAVDRIVQSWPHTIARNLPKPDYGEAYFQGLMAAEGEWAYVINVDFWDEVMLEWCWRHRGLYDLVVGSKRSDISLNKQGRYRKILSWGLNSILQLIFGFVGSDTHGQKFFKLAALRPIIGQCLLRRGQFDTELTLRAMRSGLWLAEVPVPIVEKRGPRNFMIVKICRNLVDIVRLRSVVQRIPQKGPIRYHRWAREDMLERMSIQAKVFLETAERHRELGTAA